MIIQITISYQKNFFTREISFPYDRQKNKKAFNKNTLESILNEKNEHF